MKDKLAALSKLALLPRLQIYQDNIENRRESSDSLMDVYTVTLMASITCWLYKIYVENYHHFTLTDALVTIQTIDLSVPGSELKKEMNGRGRQFGSHY